VLAFAPFVQKGMMFPHHTYNYMDQLTASGKEIAGCRVNHLQIVLLPNNSS
jgi:hypothetical protein